MVQMEELFKGLPAEDIPRMLLSMENLVKQLQLTIPLSQVIEWIKGGVLQKGITKSWKQIIPSFDMDPMVTMSVLGETFPRVIVDGGAAVNVLPVATWRRLGSPKLEAATYSLKLANELLVRPMGILANIKVDVAGIVVRIDFTIVETEKGATPYPALLGRPWLYKTQCLQNWEKVTFTLSDNNNKVVLPMLGRSSIEVIPDEGSSTTVTSDTTFSSIGEEHIFHMAEEPTTSNNHQREEPTYFGEIYNSADDGNRMRFVDYWLRDAYEVNPSSYRCNLLSQNVTEIVATPEDRNHGEYIGDYVKPFYEEPLCGISHLRHCREHWLGEDQLRDHKKKSTKHTTPRKRRKRTRHDRHDKTSYFKKGDRVWRFNNKSQTTQGELKMHWKGPYMIEKVYQNDTIQLKKLSGQLLPEMIKGSKLKPYIN